MKSNDDFFIYFDVFYVFKLISIKISVFLQKKKKLVNIQRVNSRRVNSHRVNGRF